MKNIFGIFGLPSMLLASILALPLSTQAQNDGFDEAHFASSVGIGLPYRIYTPTGSNIQRKMPLIVYLHGSGGNGTDNVKQISGGNVFGTHLWTEPRVSNENPAFVIAPQSPSNAAWGDSDSANLTQYSEIVIELVEQLIEDLPIDSNRIYLIGQSKGGRGVWDILSKRPDFFAAGIPVCGAGNADLVQAASNTPIWAFHGALDTVISVEQSRTLVRALEEVGGNIRYTEYPDVRHNSWENAFADPELPIWLFSQRRRD